VPGKSAKAEPGPWIRPPRPGPGRGGGRRARRIAHRRGGAVCRSRTTRAKALLTPLGRGQRANWRARWIFQLLLLGILQQGKLNERFSNHDSEITHSCGKGRPGVARSLRSNPDHGFCRELVSGPPVLQHRGAIALVARWGPAPPPRHPPIRHQHAFLLQAGRAAFVAQPLQGVAPWAIPRVIQPLGA